MAKRILELRSRFGPIHVDLRHRSTDAKIVTPRSMPFATLSSAATKAQLQLVLCAVSPPQDWIRPFETPKFLIMSYCRALSGLSLRHDL